MTAQLVEGILHEAMDRFTAQPWPSGPVRLRSLVILLETLTAG
ncbi:hypothetical protein [Streptomyces sp. NBC_00343]|nr:hypothetical protein [Streptomyces sp. NBC_00343]